jgi:hypothetical protein
VNVSAIAHSRPLRKEGVHVHRSGAEISLYEAGDERVHLVNASAAAIWELCDGQTEGSEMVAAICQLTGMPAEIVEEDVAHLLEGFAEANLITWVGEDPSDSGSGGPR